MPVFYTPPPAPQGAIPPKSKTPILPSQSGAGDNPPIGIHYQLLTLLRSAWDIPKLGSIDYTTIILSPSTIVADNPPRYSVGTYYNIINYWYSIPTPRPFFGYKLAVILGQADNPPFGNTISRLYIQSIAELEYLLQTLPLPQVLRLLNPVITNNPPAPIINTPLPHSLVNIPLLVWNIPPAFYPFLYKLRGGFQSPPVTLPPSTVIHHPTMIAFQPNAFQIRYPTRRNSFQGMDRFITLPYQETRPFIMLVPNVERLRYQRGSAVTLSVRCYDPSQLPPLAFNPAGGVTLTIIDPNDIIVLNNQAMDNTATGLFSYTYQTSILNTLGAYKVSYSAIGGVNVGLTTPQIGFVLQ